MKTSRNLNQRKDKILFGNRWMELVERNDWFTFARQKVGHGVSVLGYRRNKNKTEILIRLEHNPAHGRGLIETSLTGSIEGGLSPLQTAQKELLEESGYKANQKSFKSLDWVYPSKFLDYKLYLFAIDLTGQEAGPILGDGTEGERDASVKWISLPKALAVHDPSIGIILARLTKIKSLGIKK